MSDTDKMLLFIQMYLKLNELMTADRDFVRQWLLKEMILIARGE